MSLVSLPPLRQPLAVCHRLRFFIVLFVVLAVVIPVPLGQAASVAVGDLISPLIEPISESTGAAQDISKPAKAASAEIPRLTVLIGESRVISQPAKMTALLVVSPEIASVVLGAGSLRITGLRVGETMLLTFDGQRRSTWLVEVLGRTYANTHQNAMPSDPSIALSGMSGSYTLLYSAPSGDAPALFRQSFDLKQKLSKDRTLRFSSDAFKFIGPADQNRLRATAFGLGFNRLSLGIDSSSGSVDILDSQIDVSPLSFNGYAIRGLHVVSAANSALRGVELFAGFARPSQSLFETNQGRLLGIVVPLAHGESWRVRAGVSYASPGKNNTLGNGGTVWQIVGNYAPNQNIATEGEVGYANGGLSWRGRLDLQSKHLIGFGEVLRFDRRSPLVSIGAQGGGYQTQAFGLQWLANSRLNASVNFNHTAVTPPVNARRATLERNTFFANASYRFNPNQQVSFRIALQQFEIGAPAGGSRVRLETRTTTINHDLRFNQKWSNTFSASLTASREARANAATDSGINIREQLRLSLKRGSATGFVSYANQKQSLAGLIVRNPTLLPPLLQPVFEADPVLFLQQHRDILGLLLPGVELPQTSGLEAGIRFQRAFARVNMGTEVRYSAAEILGRSQRNLLASANLTMRLDAANSVLLSGSRSLGFNSAAGQSTLTLSYSHRFGAGAGGGLQFARLLGLERGVIEGRVFFDANGNGKDDPNEPGVPGMKVQIDNELSAVTGDDGHFHFQVNSGAYHIAVVAEDLGVSWRATTVTEQHGCLSARQTMKVGFGVTNYGSVAGRVFNDGSQAGAQTAGSSPGVAGVRINLRSTNTDETSLSLISDGNGAYEFRNLPPGSYLLAIDPETLPANFRLPRQTSWHFTIPALQRYYLDTPVQAQRAISGVVFIDNDGDGKFDPARDEPVRGAHITTGAMEVLSDQSGAYILRGLPAGRIQIRTRIEPGAESKPLIIELRAEPVTLRGINLAIAR